MYEYHGEEEPGDVRGETGRQGTREVLKDGERGRRDQDDQSEAICIRPVALKADGGDHRQQCENDARGERDRRRQVAIEQRRADPQQQTGGQERLEEEQNDGKRATHANSLARSPYSDGTSDMRPQLALGAG